MGARKRAAIYDVVGHRFRKAVKLTWFKCWSRDYHGRVPTIDDIKANDRYQDRRLLFRLGQRLRPCPNCMKCWPWTRFENGRLGALAPPAGAGKCYMRLELEDICDGSGVLPAKGKARR